MAFEDDEKYPGGTLSFESTIITIRVNEGVGLISGESDIANCVVDSEVGKGLGIFLCMLETRSYLSGIDIGQTPLFRGVSGGSALLHYQIYEKVPDCAGITFLSYVMYGDSGSWSIPGKVSILEGIAPTDVASSYGIKGGAKYTTEDEGFNGELGGQIEVSNAILTAKGEIGIDVTSLQIYANSEEDIPIEITASKVGLETTGITTDREMNTKTIPINVTITGESSDETIAIKQTAKYPDDSGWQDGNIAFVEAAVSVKGADIGIQFTRPSEYVYESHSGASSFLEIKDSTLTFEDISKIEIDFSAPPVISGGGYTYLIENSTITLPVSNDDNDGIAARWTNDTSLPAIDLTVTNSTITATGQAYGFYSENINWNWSATEADTSLTASADEKAIYIPTGTVDFSGGTEGMEVVATSTTVAPDEPGRTAALYIPALTSSDTTFKEIYDTEAHTIVVSGTPTNPYKTGMNISDVEAYTWENATGDPFTVHATGITSDELAGVQTIIATSDDTALSFQGPDSHHQVTLKARTNLYTVNFDVDGGTPTVASEDIY